MSELPIIISIGFLKQCGLLQSKPVPIELRFTVPRTSFKIKRLDDTIAIKPNGRKDDAIAIRWTERGLKYGQRPYFLTEDGERAIEHIVYFRGTFYDSDSFYRHEPDHSAAHLRWLVQEAKRLAQYWIPVGASKRKITGVALDAMADLSPAEIDRLPVDTFAHITQVAMNTRRTGAKPHRRNPKLGPQYALENASDLRSDLLEDLGKMSPDEYAVDPQLPVDPTLSGPVDLTSYHMLTAGSLGKVGLFKPGEISAIFLGWEWDSDSIARIMLVCEYRDRNNPILLIEFTSSEKYEGAWQRVKLEQTALNRWYFRCPELGVRCEQLFLHNGLFASGKALKA